MTLISCDSQKGLSGLSARSGITLLEVLAAIFVVGVGLLSLLTLFPLGALELARAIKDERTDRLASDALALRVDGMELLSKTFEFVAVSRAQGPDSKTAAEIAKRYEYLLVRETYLETQLLELRPLLPEPKAKWLVDRLLAQIRSIKLSTNSIAKLLRLLD